jgi:hypothetical protein
MKKTNKEIQKKLFDYFHLEQTDGKTIFLGDFSDKDFSRWLQMIYTFIQRVLKTKLFYGVKVENYVTLTLHLGGQRVDIAIVKEGKKGPHELYKELLAEREAGK